MCAACGDWFGEGSAINTERRRYDVVALRDTELICLPDAEFQRLRASSLEFNQFLVSQLNLRVSQAMALIESARLRTPEQRVALSLSKLFWGRTRKLNLSQDDLAGSGGRVAPDRQPGAALPGNAVWWCWTLAGWTYRMTKRSPATYLRDTATRQIQPA